MIILLDAELSDPPSSCACFRDVTLYASIFSGAEVLVECEGPMIDIYWHWLKREGALDFVEQLIRVGEVRGYFSIRRRGKQANVGLERLDEVSLNTAIGALARIT
jgi:hypothetical protein